MNRMQVIGRLERIFKPTLNGYQIDFELLADTMIELNQAIAMPAVVTPDVVGQIELPFVEGKE